MTIAICHVSPEGVIFGADSTASLVVNPGGFHYFNHNQKIFQIGEQSTLGLVTWGLGGLTNVSYRTLVAQLADNLETSSPSNVFDAAVRWIDLFWTAYTSDPLYQRCKTLNDKTPFDASGNSKSFNARTEDEEFEFSQLQLGLFVGFCVGGYVTKDRAPTAFDIMFHPLQGKPSPSAITLGSLAFRGAPNIIQRLIFGCDDEFFRTILASGHWNGSTSDLAGIRAQHTLSWPVLPIRDALDLVHACILSTIKALKFSSYAQVCGGPIELAVLTTDRKFRWVRHKEFDSAILEGEV
jgi:hypothetical protein